MEIKLFGKSLFSVGSDSQKAEIRYNTAADEIAKSKYLPNFYSMSQGSNGFALSDYISVSEADPFVKSVGEKKKEEKKDEGPKFSPKEVFDLKMLHDQNFQLKTDPEYIDEQLADFKDRLGMIKNTEWDMNRGTVEISSIIVRMENRKKYAEFKDFYDEYPYTTTTKIAELTKAHNYLQIGDVSQFVADLPKEAVQVMKGYTAKTKELCGKEPLYYIIADKKDFQRSEKRRDPILLAQSPFGHFWQILGAWDEEMLLVEEL